MQWLAKFSQDHESDKPVKKEYIQWKERTEEPANLPLWIGIREYQKDSFPE